MKETLQKVREQAGLHLNEAGEDYVQHLLFSIVMAGQIFLASCTLLTHGLLPFLFTRSTSRRLDKIDRVFKARVKKLDEGHKQDAKQIS